MATELDEGICGASARRERGWPAHVCGARTSAADLAAERAGRMEEGEEGQAVGEGEGGEDELLDWLLVAVDEPQVGRRKRG